LRACEADAEYAGVRATFGVDVLCADEARIDFLRVVFVAASAEGARHTEIPSSKAERRTSDLGRIRRTNPPQTGHHRLAG